MADFEIERPSVETNQVSPTFNVNIPQFTIEVQGGVQGQRGEKGEKGDPGEPGAPNVLSIGTVVSGDTANASITGTTPNQVLNLVLPQGENGQDGQDGQNGEDGVGIESVEQTTTSTEDEGNNIVTVTLTDGTTSTFTVKNGSKGSTGARGEDGAPGPAGEDGDKGEDGVGVASIEQTTTSHESGGTNIITATLTDGTTSEFYIKNGEAGGGGGGGTSDYNDLTNKPSINNVTLTGNKTTSDLGIDIPTATSDLTNDSGFITSSSLPTKVSDLTNDAGYITSYTETDPIYSASAASGITSTDITNWNNKSDFSGSYNDLTNKPTIPTVNNAKLTIQKNGTTVKTFTANASSNVTANITVPTQTSDLTNNSGYITKSVSDLTNYTPTSSLATVATSGSYNDLSNTPTIPTVPTNVSAFTNDSGYITGITDGDVRNALGYTPEAEAHIYAFYSIRDITSTSDQTYIDLIDDITNHRPIIIRVGMMTYANVLGTYDSTTALLWFKTSDNSCTTITLIDEGSSVDVQVTTKNFAVTNANNRFSVGQTIAGETVVDSIRTKNMFDMNEARNGAIKINSTSEKLDYNTNSLTTGWIPCKPNTNYTISGSYNRSRWQTKASNETITYGGENQTTITTNSTAKWLRFYYYYGNAGTVPSDVPNFQVEEGNTATAYAPYQNLNPNIIKLDMMDDTSGSSWQDMMKNKLDYCISTIDTNRGSVETFINGGWNGVNYGFGVFSKIGNVYQLVWFSSNAIYYCRNVFGTYDYTNITGQDGGTATVNTACIGNVENNHYEKYGRVVSYSFTMTVKGNWGPTTQFLSGLPKAQSYTRFMGLNASNQTIMRFAIDTNGNISNAYSNTTPSSNHTIEGHITYIASE